jgi:hypothetical protein
MNITMGKLSLYKSVIVETMTTKAAYYGGLQYYAAKNA